MTQRGAVGFTVPPAGCTTTTGSVTCTYTTITTGTTVTRAFRVPIGALALGPVTITATRTVSAPTDPNSANDTDTATCNVLSVVLVTCN